MLEIIKKLENVTPRKGKNERKAVKIIKDELSGIEIYEQKFRNTLPIGEARLEVDGKEIKCEATSFISGKIDEKILIPSIYISARFFNHPNINFNPYCKLISLATFYFAPSLAIEKKNVKKIIDAEVINGKVMIKKEKYASENIIVGNLKNPKIAIFTHYDSVKKGAVDNSSGVSLLVHMIKERSDLLKKSVFIFSGSEELSFNNPIYWGKGYRIFEEEYKTLLENCKRIYVVDSLGFDEPIITKDFLVSALPLKNMEKWKPKIFLLISEIKKLWNFYHSDLDKLSVIKKDYLEKAKDTLLYSLLKV